MSRETIAPGPDQPSVALPAGRHRTAQAALEYLDRGWAPIPVPHQSKAPAINNWQNQRIGETAVLDHFTEPTNVGVLLGAPSGGLVDIDLDTAEARRLAPDFLPPTMCRFGRASSRLSHYLYRCPAPLRRKPYQVPGIGTLVELRADGAQTIFPPSVHPSGETIEWDVNEEPAEVDVSTLQEAVCKLAVAALLLRNWTDGHRDDLALAAVGVLTRAGWTIERVEHCIDAVARSATDEQRISRVEKARRAAERFARGEPVAGVRRLEEVIGQDSARAISNWARFGAPQIATAFLVSAPAGKKTREWPDPLNEAAFYGLAGEVVRTLDPHTEADPAFIIVQLLVAFGNAVGRGPHFRVEADRHGANLFAVCVGETAKARKGASWGQSRRIVDMADDTWPQRVASGLSSGEGLIWQVRDRIEKNEPVKERGRIARYQLVTVDEGISDKRLLVYEGEFASTLCVLSREGNTLSAVIRNAWDKGDLSTLTKNTPARATRAHISIVGHITNEELLRHLSDTEAANGFANRFLWLCGKRSKLLPDGGALDERDLQSLAATVTEALEFARGLDQVRWNDEAREIWHGVYRDLSEARPGLVGAITARAEAHVVRLALVYALLDRSAVICAPHLRAALAVWGYAQASAEYIFGDRLGDPVADTIRQGLHQAPNGLTRTDIHTLVGRHASAACIDVALSSLSRAGVARCQVESTGGRSAERWFST